MRQKSSRLFRRKVLKVPFLLILGFTFCVFLIILRYLPSRNANNFYEVYGFDGNECKCISLKTGLSYDFCYVDPQNKNSIGKKFSCSHLEVLENLNLIGSTAQILNISETIKNKDNVVFVSATSDDHFNYSTTSFESIQKFYPHHKYVLYGLNLSEAYVNQLPKNENFNFRQFNTSAYPEFVNNWKKYHFKGLVLAEAMKEFPIIWWIDANIALTKPNIIESIFNEVSENRLSNNYSSIISFRATDHSNFAVLHPDLLNYFPSNSIELLQREMQVGSGIIFVPKTEYTVKIVKWWVLCSLEEICMNPSGSQVFCNFSSNKFGSYANCFRYDQSVLNLLLLNDFQEHHKYFMNSLIDSFVRIK